MRLSYGISALDLAGTHYKPVIDEFAKLDPKDENGIVASFALVRGGQARRDDHRAGAINGLRKRKQRRRKAIRRPQNSDRLSGHLFTSGLPRNGGANLLADSCTSGWRCRGLGESPSAGRSGEG